MNLHPHPFLHIYTIKLQNRLHIPPEFLVYDIYIHFWNRPHYKNNAWWMGMRGMSECMWFKRRSRVNTNSKIWIYTKTLVLNIDCQVNYITSDNSRIPPPSMINTNILLISVLTKKVLLLMHTFLSYLSYGLSKIRST